MKAAKRLNRAELQDAYRRRENAWSQAADWIARALEADAELDALLDERLAGQADS